MEEDFPDWQENDNGDGGPDYGDEERYAGGGAEGGGGNNSDDGGNSSSSGGSSSGSSSSDEAGDREGGSDGEGNIDFGGDFRDLERTKGGALQAGGPSLHGSKSRRSPEDAAKEKADGIMSGEKMYSTLGLTSKERESIKERIYKTPNIERLSIEVYVLSLLFSIRKLDVKKDFVSFFKKTDGIEAVDLLRYIRANPR